MPTDLKIDGNKYDLCRQIRLTATELAFKAMYETLDGKPFPPSSKLVGVEQLPYTEMPVEISAIAALDT
ncbi:hypothetical protein [Parahaliea mediterranea]|uniref:hypothetical protein n=1 Tax=Parahaliea mediterranea TaxID=651086 RepID=UPI000E2F4124|nr:hypothetical protein [Parahaliea mediterranea]